MQRANKPKATRSDVQAIDNPFQTGEQDRLPSPGLSKSFHISLLSGNP